jgi:ribosome-associated protein
MSEERELVERVNKTRVKLHVDALVNLGKSIAALSKDQFEAMPLSDEFRQALIEVRKLSKGGAIKRQFKYIGKKLREMDEEELDGLFQGLDRQLDKDRSATSRLHSLEQWRDKLVQEGDAALSDFLQEYPASDRQHIRQLQRKAKQELERQKPPAAARKIFQYIKEISLED